MSSAATLVRPQAWSVDLFKAFWGKRRPGQPVSVDSIVTPDIVGCWPRPIGIVRGAVPYGRVIQAVLAVSDDFTLTVPEHAATGEFTFVHWHATGTLDGTRLDFHGCDRIRQQPDGRVSENYIFCDHPYFERVADWLAHNS
ncbi:MAG: nuclear transport factor 2 family protein [Alphaproteobacteria bacterium]|nr:nuclear transport factor 2 family protein [Alphaproteobacteria bacterium]MBL7098156.1 nuclear transport factor 2 family protein [Alphaproteobacteria bacterium]